MPLEGLSLDGGRLRNGDTHQSIRSRTLLAHHEADRDERALAVSSFPHFFQQRPPCSFANQAPLHVELLGHVVELALDIRVVNAEAAIVRSLSLVQHLCQGKLKRFGEGTDLLSFDKTRAALSHSPLRAHHRGLRRGQPCESRSTCLAVDLPLGT